MTNIFTGGNKIISKLLEEKQHLVTGTVVSYSTDNPLTKPHATVSSKGNFAQK